MTNALSGIGYFFRGVGLLTRPGVRRFVIIPLLANAVVFALMTGAIYQALSGLYLEYSYEVTGNPDVIPWLAKPLIWLVGTLVSGYVSLFVVLFLTAPFLGILSKRLEEHLTGDVIPSGDSPLQAVLSVPRSFLRELQKFLHYLPLAVLTLVISVIPGINVAAPILWMLLGAWMMSLQFVDYPMDNNALSFSEVREACSAHRTTSITFGAVVAFVSGIPVINLVLIPAAVAGATLFWCEALRHRR